jgi:hypothetical protein
VLTTLEFFWNSQHGPEPDATGYKGFYYHFLNMESGRRTGTTELSTIDTALLLGGVVFVGEYFDGDNEREERVRALSDSIYHRVEWDWASPRSPRVSHGWRPESGFIPYDWIGYNEAMILYILALGSPTYPIPEAAWGAWTSGYRWETYFGVPFVRFPPLFGHQYSHVWVDFQGIRDEYMRNRGIDYFVNSRRATMANRNYCIANPGGWNDYGPDVWGLTASDGPNGYSARGAPPAQNDDGTITPTAAGGSIVFTPDLSTAALRTFYENYRTRLWGPYGFRDAFNPTVDWFDTDYLGIDQGPIVLMIENLRNGGVWSRFMQNTDIQRGLERAGFEPVGTAADPASELPSVGFTLSAFPNPFTRSTRLRIELGRAAEVQLQVFDSIGRRVAEPMDGFLPSGSHQIDLHAGEWAAGVYHYLLTVNRDIRYGQLIHLK